MPDVTITVTDRHGNVVFVGKPGPDDIFELEQAEGQPAKLYCTASDMTVQLQR